MDDLNVTKERMKAYRDIYGGELSRKDLIDDAKTIFDLDNIFAHHFGFIEEMAKDAESNLYHFKRELGVF